MRHPCVSSFAFVCAAPLAAQTVTVGFVHPIVVSARANTGYQQWSLQQPGTQWASAYGHDTHADATTTLTPLARGLRWGSTVTVRNGPLGFGTGQSTVAGPDLRLTVTGAPAGKIVVAASGSSSGAGTVTANYFVDVHADNQREVVGSLTTLRREIGVCFSGPLTVRVGLELSTTLNVTWSSSTANLDLSVTFEPAAPPIEITPYGQPCGPQLTGTDTVAGFLHQVRLELAGAAAFAPAALVLGLQRTRVPIQGTPCFLYAVPIFAAVTTADAQGRAVFAMPIPGPHPRFVFAAQGATLSAGSLSASNGLELLLQDC